MYTYLPYKKGYLIGADGKYYKVSVKVWTDYMRSIWREDAARKRDCSKVRDNKTGTYTGECESYSKVTSFDKIVDVHGDNLLPHHASVEEELIRRISRDDIYICLYRAMDSLEPEECLFLEKLYFEGDGMSIYKYAKRCMQPYSTVKSRHRRCLKKLRKIMESDKKFSASMLDEVLEDAER